MTEDVLSSTVTNNDDNNKCNNNNEKAPINNDNVVTINIVEPTVDGNGETAPTPKKNKKKKPGTFGFLKAAILMLRSRTNEKKKKITEVTPPAVNSTGDWKKIVGSMRPLHLQDNQSPPPSLPPITAPSPPVEFYDTSRPYSPYSPYSPSPSTSSVGTMSQYASASNLQDLYGDIDDEEEEEDPDQVFDAIGADEMIDAKAEEFIAQFYQQMRRQHFDSINIVRPDV